MDNKTAGQINNIGVGGGTVAVRRPVSLNRASLGTGMSVFHGHRGSLGSVFLPLRVEKNSGFLILFFVFHAKSDTTNNRRK